MAEAPTHHCTSLQSSDVSVYHWKYCYVNADLLYLHRYASVWKETARVFDEMEASEGWTHKSVVEIPSVNSLMIKVRPLSVPFAL